ncbi:Cytochrome bo(3) ubiquinol oxidase subunit 3 [Pleomorphomonas sp. T1.2MG-36]|uniref:cytochrome o ubiquinol oxidase subunit III n=1 Tax=Pleomorphomonas sp. T1.2MG-36 TaxID=3041167 RepID=UPI0024775B99|nr:cytochrome o ubiquinol oxidase subunit III [Pleomorphomonas sp. T1.2MG-36]CAI9418346.1 Cytochrome bo(3) ubiquinol oxidase subunit 3 [Pleomorphomonas sp. T1.2MG-36]
MTILDLPEAHSLHAEQHPPAHEDDAELTEKTVFGFWLYLMSDVVLFATLFAVYAVVGRSYAGGPTGRELFDLWFVLAETAVLLASSVAFGFVTLAAQDNRKTATLAWMAVTFAIGALFIVMELYEFHHLIAEGAGPSRSAFLSAYFALVGTHGLHVFTGLLWMIVMAVQLARDGLSATVHRRLGLLGLFWHFLDVIWIVVFTEVYLIGVL